jgi:peptidoglycan L-alanyl-D-glutamate endopeptidase CwlK
MSAEHSFGPRSLANLETVHKDLKMLAFLALKYSPYDFTITEGNRSVEQQKINVAKGASKTMNSYHLDTKDGVIDGKGMALDFYPFFAGQIQVQAPMSYFKAIADAFKKAAAEKKKKITWGGDWKTFKDGPHIQLEK